MGASLDSTVLARMIPPFTKAAHMPPKGPAPQERHPLPQYLLFLPGHIRLGILSHTPNVGSKLWASTKAAIYVNFALLTACQGSRPFLTSLMQRHIQVAVCRRRLPDHVSMMGTSIAARVSQKMVHRMRPFPMLVCSTGNSMAMLQVLIGLLQKDIALND